MITAASILNSECADKLFDYQKNRIVQIYREYLEANESQNQFAILYCPKCKIANPDITKGGFSNSGKQMYYCKHCRKRFVHDTGKITFYSHQSSAEWFDFIKATMETKSLRECSALIDVHESTAFRMRHRFLSFLEAADAIAIEENPLDNQIEFDETYYRESHKGLKDKQLYYLEREFIRIHPDYTNSNWEYHTFVEERERLNKKIQDRKIQLHQKKRGISSDQVCVITGVERLGEAVIKATNLAKPGIEDVRKLSHCFKDGSYAFIDGCTSYRKILEEKRCKYSVCPTRESYDKINHLNTVNSLHSKMDESMRKYRGVSTIYINRYGSLLRNQHKYASCDSQEIAVNLISRLNSIQHYFTHSDINRKNIFDIPQIMELRQNCIDELTIYRLHCVHA